MRKQFSSLKCGVPKLEFPDDPINKLTKHSAFISTIFVRKVVHSMMGAMPSMGGFCCGQMNILIGNHSCLLQSNV